MQLVDLRRRCVRRLRLKFEPVRDPLRMCGQVQRKCAAVGMLVRSWLSGSEEPGLRSEALPMLREALPMSREGLCEALPMSQEVPPRSLEALCEVLSMSREALPMLREALLEA